MLQLAGLQLANASRAAEDCFALLRGRALIVFLVIPKDYPAALLRMDILRLPTPPSLGAAHLADRARLLLTTTAVWEALERGSVPAEGDDTLLVPRD